MSELPIVLLPLGADEDALDACLAALEANTPAGTPVWLADDAQAGPRGIALVERWLQRTGLRAEYTRRSHPIGQVAHLQQMLQACGDADAVLLAPDARPEISGMMAGRPPTVVSPTMRQSKRESMIE